jgi:hypothetical protein
MREAAQRGADWHWPPVVVHKSWMEGMAARLLWRAVEGVPAWRGGGPRNPQRAGRRRLPKGSGSAGRGPSRFDGEDPQAPPLPRVTVVEEGRSTRERSEAQVLRAVLAGREVA